MAYQDVFVRITDTNGSRQSYSSRRKVKWVNTDIYFANNTILNVLSAYDKNNDKLPEVRLHRSPAEPSFHGEPTMVVDLTGLLGTPTYLRIGDRIVDLGSLRFDAERLFKEIVVSQLSA